MDLFEIHAWNCPTDEQLYQSIIEQKRVFKFLMGLNSNLDEVRGRILATKPLPSLRAAFSDVRQEESRRKVMQGPSLSASNPIDGSALATHHHSSMNTEEAMKPIGGMQGPPQRKPRQGRFWCDKCKSPSHNIESCWKIHGKPAD